MNIRRLKPGAFVELECKHFVSEGLGLSYFADEAMKEKFKPHVFFIWGVLPGERFIARIAKVKTKLAHGLLARREDLPPEFVREFAHETWALLNLSPERRVPPCEIFLRCGGCKMQHMSYDDTLKYKEAWLRSQLKHHRVELENIRVDRAPDAELLHYRNHVQVHINKFGVYGFYEPLSYRTRAFPDHGCLIFDEKSLRADFPRFPVEVRAARIRRNSDGRAVFTELNSKAEARETMRYTVAWPPGSETQIEFPLQQFFQVNLKILPRWLGEMATYFEAAHSPARVLELFSGFGFISRMLQQRFTFDVLACDVIAKAEVEKVRFESAERSLSADFAAHYHRADLFLPEKMPESLLTAMGDFKPDALIVNPPRAGLLRETWQKFREGPLSSFAGPIIYSSCNAATMARDIGYLHEEGYRVREMKLFDFFPWTHHFETVAFLTRT